MEYVLKTNDELLERVYETPRSVIKNNNGLNDYYSVISSTSYPDCNSAIMSMVPLIQKKLPEIYRLIDDVDLSAIKKQFLKVIIQKRFELILLDTYNKLKGSL